MTTTNKEHNKSTWVATHKKKRRPLDIFEKSETNFGTQHLQTTEINNECGSGGEPLIDEARYMSQPDDNDCNDGDDEDDNEVRGIVLLDEHADAGVVISSNSPEVRFDTGDIGDGSNLSYQLF